MDCLVKPGNDDSEKSTAEGDRQRLFLVTTGLDPVVYAKNRARY
jgi:hypothetical protein